MEQMGRCVKTDAAGVNVPNGTNGPTGGAVEDSAGTNVPVDDLLSSIFERRPRALPTLHGLLDEHRRDISMSAQPLSYQISIDTSPPASAAEIVARSANPFLRIQ
jgi:hypothetical protein